jgi:thioesterase domain-containing protein
MADHYIDAIRTVQPEGPYLLGGHSAGGVIVYAIAQRLMSEGQEVHLFILDTATPHYYSGLWAHSDGVQSDAERLIGIATVMEKHLGKELHISCDDLQTLNFDDQLRYFLEKLREGGIALPEGDDGIVMLRGLLNVVQCTHKAIVAYRPQDGPKPPLTLFRAEERMEVPQMSHEIPPIGVDDPTWGWSALASVPVQVHIVPGDHITMLTSPHAEILAERLRACLAEVTDEWASRGVAEL